MLVTIVLNDTIIVTRMRCMSVMMVHAIMPVGGRSIRLPVRLRRHHVPRNRQGERGTRLHGQPDRDKDEKQFAQHLVGPVESMNVVLL